MFNSQLKRGKFLNEFLVELQIMQIKIWYYFELWFKQELVLHISSWRQRRDWRVDWLVVSNEKCWLELTGDWWEGRDTGQLVTAVFRHGPIFRHTLQLNFSEGQLSDIFYCNFLKPSKWGLNTNPPTFWGTPYDVRFGMGLYIHNGGVPALKLCSVCCLPVMI